MPRPTRDIQESWELPLLKCSDFGPKGLLARRFQHQLTRGVRCSETPCDCWLIPFALAKPSSIVTRLLVEGFDIPIENNDLLNPGEGGLVRLEEILYFFIPIDAAGVHVAQQKLMVWMRHTGIKATQQSRTGCSAILENQGLLRACLRPDIRLMAHPDSCERPHQIGSPLILRPQSRSVSRNPDGLYELRSFFGRPER